MNSRGHIARRRWRPVGRLAEEYDDQREELLPFIAVGIVPAAAGGREERLRFITVGISPAAAGGRPRVWGGGSILGRV